MSGKIITVHPDLFNFSSKNKTKKEKPPLKEIKMKNNKTIKNAKKHILQELRRRQEENINHLFQSKPLVQSNASTDSITPNNDFEQSIEYLTSFTKDYDDKKENEKNSKNHTFKKNPEMDLQSLLYSDNADVFNNTLDYPLENVSNSFNMENSMQDFVLKPRIPLPQPEWGCLKNGKLQTYRIWKKQTQKNLPSTGNLSFTPTIIVNSDQERVMPHSFAPTNGSFAKENPSSPSSISNKIESREPFSSLMPYQNQQEEKIKFLSEMKQTMQKMKNANNMKNKKQLKQRKTVRRTFHIGKSKTAPKISVLVTNKAIRKNVTTKATLLKQTPIGEIRKYLIKKGLIKVGSSAPNDVLRKMYESVALIGGDINNHNPENLLYNYFHDK